MNLVLELEKYQHQKVDAITTIRHLTNAVNREYVIEVLAIVNLISRIEQGDAERSMIGKLIGGISRADQANTN